MKNIIFEGDTYLPYPQNKPKDYTPIMVLTKDDKVHDVIQIDTGFGREFINEVQRIFLFPEDVKGWRYKLTNNNGQL
jgi:hypothetical protein